MFPRTGVRVPIGRSLLLRPTLLLDSGTADGPSQAVLATVSIRTQKRARLFITHGLVCSPIYTLTDKPAEEAQALLSGNQPLIQSQLVLHSSLQDAKRLRDAGTHGPF